MEDLYPVFILCLALVAFALLVAVTTARMATRAVQRDVNAVLREIALLRQDYLQLEECHQCGWLRCEPPPKREP